MKRVLTVCLALLLLLAAACAETPVEAQMVLIPARPDFAFAKDLTNTEAGEASPILENYYLSRTKVTNAEYKLFLDATGRKAPSYWADGMYPDGKADHPVVAVSYSDAAAYCEWLSAQVEGWSFRLPTEEEWENAARGAYYDDPSAKYPTGVSLRYDAESCTITTDFNYNGVITAELMRTLGAAPWVRTTSLPISRATIRAKARPWANASPSAGPAA